MKYPILILGAAFALIAADPTPSPAPSATASPTSDFSPAPIVTAAPSNPSVTPTPAIENIFAPHRGRGKGATPAASPTPIPDARKGLDGVWEVQIQRGGTDTEYTHFSIKQTGTALAGTYLTHDNKKFPVAGTLEGTTVHLIVSLPDNTTILLDGKVDGTTDMIGMFTDAKERVPFTAAYRPKEKWIDNLNTQPGGLAPPGNGGIPPV